MGSKPILYSYWRSSASFRVRIALALKGIDYESQAVNLIQGDSEGTAQTPLGNLSSAYRELNPQGLIPTWQDEHITLGQSQAIIDYLDARYPDPPLLPTDPVRKAHCRAMAQVIACEIHPLNNLSILKYLTGTLGIDEDAKMSWYHHWIIKGFRALEQQTRKVFGEGQLSLGDRPGYFEAFLIPQMYNARRFDCPLDDFPNLRAMDATCRELDAFKDAAPENQPDAVK